MWNVNLLHSDTRIIIVANSFCVVTAKQRLITKGVEVAVANKYTNKGFNHNNNNITVYITGYFRVCLFSRMAKT